MTDEVHDTFLTEPIETGLVTATVNEPAGLTEEGKQALKALVTLPPFTPPQLAAIARDIAMDILTPAALLTKHKMTQAQYDYLVAHNQFYQGLLQHSLKEWQGINSTEQRVRAQSLAAYEELLPVIAGRMGQQSEKLVDVVEGAKLLAKTGGLDANAGGPRSSGEGFTISIDLGADTKLTIGPAQAAPGDPGQAGAVTIHQDAEGSRQGQAIQGQPEGQRRAAPVRLLPAGACEAPTGVPKP